MNSATVNIQPIEKYRNTTENVEVHSIFYTIQGEGPFSGQAAVFIRLAGCNLQCPMCDTDYTSERKKMTAVAVAREVERLIPFPKVQRCLVVITGGEPFRQNLNLLILQLLKMNCYVQIESNGTLRPTWYGLFSRAIGSREGVYLVVSPKTPKLNGQSVLAACAFKYVLDERSWHADGLPDKVLGLDNQTRWPVSREFPAGVPIYIQPADTGDENQNRLNEKAAIKACMDNGVFIYQQQLHKKVGLP